MQTKQLTVPWLGMIAVTRAMLGAGVGLLASSRLEDRRRRGLGLALVGIGVATTLPLALKVFGRGSASREQAAIC